MIFYNNSYFEVYRFWLYTDTCHLQHMPCDWLILGSYTDDSITRSVDAVNSDNFIALLLQLLHLHQRRLQRP